MKSTMKPRTDKGSLGFAVIGAGRIGNLHAHHLAGAIDGAHLVAVMDTSLEAAKKAAYGKAYVAQTVDIILQDSEVGAVVIASPTSLHGEQIEAVAASGRAIFCEKPVASNLEETVAAMKSVKKADVPFQIGFNRRFDPAYAEVARAIKAGELGQVELFRSQSSDPELPPREYTVFAGSYYLDSIIHDIDSARFMVGEIEQVTALGRALAAPYLAETGDIDTSILTLEFTRGALGVLMNSRRTVHGYDLRIEVHGEKGKLVAEDERATKVWRYGKDGIHGDYYYYFLERFKDAYRLELQAFADAVRGGRPPSPGPTDAIQSLRVVLAATKSLKEGGKPVTVAEVQASA
jgi:myo-inositol 2-dehydrogenase/D-chiro-inositol 1-dehydrogenase